MVSVSIAPLVDDHGLAEVGKGQSQVERSIRQQSCYRRTRCTEVVFGLEAHQRDVATARSTVRLTCGFGWCDGRPVGAGADPKGCHGWLIPVDNDA